MSLSAVSTCRLTPSAHGAAPDDNSSRLAQWCHHFHLQPGLSFRRLRVSPRDARRPDIVYVVGTCRAGCGESGTAGPALGPLQSFAWCLILLLRDWLNDNGYIGIAIKNSCTLTLVLSLDSQAVIFWVCLVLSLKKLMPEKIDPFIWIGPYIYSSLPEHWALFLRCHLIFVAAVQPYSGWGPSPPPPQVCLVSLPNTARLSAHTW